MGNDPTGRNPRRAAGDGDPARTSGAVLERERERETKWGERRMGMGELELPLPVFNPPSALDHTVVPHVTAVVPPRAEVPHCGVSTAPQAAVKNYCRAGGGSTVRSSRGSTARHYGSTARAEVPHRGRSTAPPGGSKKLLPRWVRKYRAPPLR